MDPKSHTVYAAPAASVASSFRLPGTRDFPRLDDHLVRPETREEVVRGVHVMAMGANPPHAERQTKLDLVIEPHVAPGYVAATDLLTRFSSGSNFATDLCIRKEGVDAEGVRHLEELAFEIVSEQSRKSITERAEEMTSRGVRRLIAIFVKSGTIEEWSRETQCFEPLSLDAELVDPTLTRPLPLRALLDAAVAYDEVAKAFDQRGVPYMVELRRRSEQKGKAEGKRELLTRLLEQRFGALPASAHAQLQRADAAQLDTWSERLFTAPSLDDLLR